MGGPWAVLAQLPDYTVMLRGCGRQLVAPDAGLASPTA